MSAPASIHPTAHDAAAPRAAVPPYVAPAARTVPEGAVTRVGPFVPGAWRATLGATPTPAVRIEETPAHRASETAEPSMLVTATPPVATMAVPASIPPYRPLRPTPIVSPAMRTPLYIPPIPTPAAEAAVEDDGVIEPVLVHTAEYDVPVEPAVSATIEVATDAESTVPEALAAEVTPLSATPVQELPWIDAFLAATPALPMPAVPSPAEVLPSVAEFVVDEVDSAPAEEWPLEEAAAEFQALSAQLDRETSATEPSAPLPLSPLAPWTDDDMMDIMPIRHSGKTPLTNTAIPSDGELWAERARKAHEEAQVFRAMAAARPDPREGRGELQEIAPEGQGAPESTAEEAAHALELLARRVRAGELTLPSYDPRMGEPAALVAALAALLGVRLR